MTTKQTINNNSYKIVPISQIKSLCLKSSSLLLFLLFQHGAGHQWVTSVILATWEAEIRRIRIGGQPGQKVLEGPSQPIVGCSGIPCHPKLHRRLRSGGLQ
jgi:hypothetical protein